MVHLYYTSAKNKLLNGRSCTLTGFHFEVGKPDTECPLSEETQSTKVTSSNYDCWNVVSKRLRKRPCPETCVWLNSGKEMSYVLDEVELLRTGTADISI